jgi:hypothetical protein
MIRHIRTFIAAILLVGIFTAPALADGPTPKQRVEFMKLVKERNTLAVRLRRLDKQAADQLRIGNEPIVVHAAQVSVQDQLDLIELRLAILSTRYGEPVPPLPDSIKDAANGNGSSADARIAKVFERGRLRALIDLEDQVRDFLATMDFSEFLSSP